MIASPSPVHETPPSVLSAYVPLPIRAESPTRPGSLPTMPPVDVAAAIVPWRSSATAPTVPAAFTAPGVEARVILERAHGRFDGVHGPATLFQHAPSGRDRCPHTDPQLVAAIGRIGAGAAVDD